MRMLGGCTRTGLGLAAWCKLLVYLGLSARLRFLPQTNYAGRRAALPNPISDPMQAPPADSPLTAVAILEKDRSGDTALVWYAGLAAASLCCCQCTCSRFKLDRSASVRCCVADHHFARLISS
jgi:hypothetical protein